MTWWHAVVIVLAGTWAGTINTVVGSGTLVTFPVLVALGYPPVTATTSNAIGLAPGAISGSVGYRRELAGQRDRVLRFAVFSVIGAGVGTVLLLSLPEKAFETIVPWLIGLAVVLVLVQPKVSAWVLRTSSGDAPRGGLLVLPLIFVIGIYGGYFTAAQGVLLMGVLGILVRDSLQRLNALKNVLAAAVNVVAGTVYAFLAPVSWPVIALLAISSTLGGLLGAKIGRRLPPSVLRATIVVIGVAAIANFLLS
ncbi:sulfite exporter TauE/SafE family protein [Haloechinothrix sp. YIM 98757]|uniref:Probable membrane transporter protein n=1 Tax=Haloechinothrix aidingensis TaxID=2752311 RepID=A0A838A7S8_9PSEU|nr:sulfite exporter TauE/SafE family protein [Haloechinothrix aidingensis]MBA0124232.1 sulfite exporter TauE/SafE family protein [Haloechinothrix aidingensis]